MFLGTRAAAAPFVYASKLYTALYFIYFIIFLPLLAYFSRNMFRLNRKATKFTAVPPFIKNKIVHIKKMEPINLKKVATKTRLF